MMKSIGGAALALLAMAGCSAQESAEAPAEEAINVSDASANVAAPTPSSANAEIRNPAGDVVGHATATEENGELRVRAGARGLPAGAHGIHVHTAGLCEAPAFESAGSHWNPTSRKHGQENPAGSHLGDLPNIEIGADGSGTVEFTVAGGSLAGANALLDADGAAVVIHADPDDYRTDPSGNSGGRIACGVFR